MAFVYLGVNVSLDTPGPFDSGLRDTLMGNFGSGPIGSLLDALNTLGGLEVGAVLTIALAGLFLGLRRSGAAIAIASTWLAEGVSSIAKELLQRPRPTGALVDSALSETWSYPSGHVVRTTAVVAVLVWLALDDGRRDWLRRTLLGLAAGLAAGFVMGLARVATGAHWPTDVIGGLLLGAVYVLAFGAMAEELRRARARARRPPPSPGPGSA
ncbi:MAG TPA: phosphatase PAP2 family protein [Candidatus Limnocylindrales bacterium]